MKIKPGELNGAALNWAVAMCFGWKWKADEKGVVWLARPDPKAMRQVVNATSMRVMRLSNFHPIANWSMVGPIIEREKIDLSFLGHEINGFQIWRAEKLGVWGEEGFTPLVAAMRCYVGSVMGNEVELPEALAKGAKA
jgi:hypothetical protein